MRFCSFRYGGTDRFGLVAEAGVVDLTAPDAADLASAIGSGLLGALAAGADERHVLAWREVELLPTIPGGRKVVCIGLNYEPHRIEMGRDKDPFPTVFIRMEDTLVAPGGDLVKPRNSPCFDYEGEIAVVIGKAGRHIAEADAMAHVVGYTIFMDASVRDFQKQNLIAGKNFPATGGMGPWMTTADAMPGPSDVRIETRLNGKTMQQGALDELTFTIPELIAYVSSWTPLAPGDVISTGTPSGVGTARNPPVYMKPGDTVEVEVTGIGVLQHRIVGES